MRNLYEFDYIGLLINVTKYYSKMKVDKLLESMPKKIAEWKEVYVFAIIEFNSFTISILIVY
jgi:hypothetical protein